MAKEKEVVDLSNGSDDSEYAKRFRVASSLTITATSPARGPSDVQAPAGEVEVKKNRKRKAASDGATSSKTKGSGEAKRLRIRGSSDWITVGSFVRLRCGQSTSVVRVTKIERDPSAQAKHKVHVKWCYKPEETKAGRQPYHGVNELLVSDRETVEEWTRVAGICSVFTLEDDMKRVVAGRVGAGPTYFWRFRYETKSGNCYKADYYCNECNNRSDVGPFRFLQQLRGRPPVFSCPLCFPPPHVQCFVPPRGSQK